MTNVETPMERAFPSIKRILWKACMGEKGVSAAGKNRL
jgi:hypothetical protein